jgi:ATP-dependent Clp protease ATP-binding subunit ClpA
MAGAEQKLDPNSKKIITKKDITKIVSRLSNIPLEDLEKSDKDKLRNLENTLQKQIFGQDEAINIITNNILLSKSTIYEKEKPIGSFLFAGPSGVGKTELAKQLAKQLSIPFIRLDMSEYMEKHNVARLIGTPPGYVGYEEGGQLTEIVNKTPYCVLLLDEIEKSHKDVFNILLQIMDYGILTDGKGNKTNFHNVILIMTSNVGAKEMNKNEIGFTKNSQQVIKNRELEIKHLFSPEFLNRLDSIVQFNALNQIDLNKIIIKSLSKLQENLSNKKIIMLYSDLVISHIAKNGFDEKMGARPIQRYIEKEISQLLSKEILFGNLENGGEFKIDIIDDKINFDFIHNYQVHDISNKIENIFSKELIIKEKKPRKKIIKKVE